jgi:hypothetical protein
MDGQDFRAWEDVVAQLVVVQEEGTQQEVVVLDGQGLEVTVVQLVVAQQVVAPSVDVQFQGLGPMVVQLVVVQVLLAFEPWLVLLAGELY